MNTIKENKLNPKLLSRKTFADNKFTGYEGEIYIYVLDILISSINGNITNKFWILKKINEDTFLKVPNGDGNFIFTTSQQDGVPFRNLDGGVVYLKDEEGNIITESVEITNEEGETVIEERPLDRVEEFTRNVNDFADIIIPAVNITIDRYLGQ